LNYGDSASIDRCITNSVYGGLLKGILRGVNKKTDSFLSYTF
jgi:hypothetical protein